MDFKISVGMASLDMKVVHRCLSEESYWAKDCSFETVRRAFENSFCFGVHHVASGNLAGFCRVVTDYVTFAYIMDFFILRDYRKCGTGTLLMSHVIHHPDLARVGKWRLATKDAHGFYEKFGFRRLNQPDAHMERTR